MIFKLKADSINHIYEYINNNKIQVALYLILLLAIIFSLLSYIGKPICGDVKTFFAAARQADYIGNFPYNIYLSWELKPLLTRLLAYCIYKIATFFSDFQHKETFELAVKLIYSMVVFFIILLSTAGMRKFLTKYNISSLLVFFVLLFSFYSLSFWSSMQAEEFCVLLVIISAPLVLSDSRLLNTLGGFLLGFLLLLKIITVLIAFQVFLLLYFLGDQYRKNIKYSGIGFIGSLILIMLLLYFIFPNEITEFRNTALFQDSLNLQLSDFYLTLYYFLNFAGHNPITLAGFLISWILLPLFIRHRQWQNLVMYYVIWGISFTIVIIQGKFWAYHYTVFIIPSIITLFLFHVEKINWSFDLNKKDLAMTIIWFSVLVIFFIALSFDKELVIRNYPGDQIAIVILMIIFISFCSLNYRIFLNNKEKYNPTFVFLIGFSVAVWAIFNSSLGIYYHGSKNEILYEGQVYESLVKKYDLTAQKQILYLANGPIAYYLGVKSYDKYFFPLPVQRSFELKKIKETDIYKKTLQHILNYKGDIIVIQTNWFDLKNYPEVERKVISEYEILYKLKFTSRPITIYKRKKY